MPGILDYLQDKKKKALGYMEQDPQMQVLSGVLGQYGEEGLDFLQQPGDVDEFMRRRGYKGEAEYPSGMEMVPVADVLGDVAFTSNSAEDFMDDPSLMNAGKTVFGAAMTATPFIGMGAVKGAAAIAAAMGVSLPAFYAMFKAAGNNLTEMARMFPKQAGVIKASHGTRRILPGSGGILMALFSRMSTVRRICPSSRPS
jgi:hypothetical protein